MDTAAARSPMKAHFAIPWRRAARLSTLLARWWADARATAYAPDGAGAQRAGKLNGFRLRFWGVIQ